MALQLLAAIFTFVGVTGLAMSIFRGETIGTAVEKRLKVLNRRAPEAHAATEDMLETGASSLPLLRSLSASAWGDKSLLDLKRAGSSLKVSEYFLLRLLVGFLAGLLGAVLFRGSGLGILLAAIAAIAGYMVPKIYVNVRKGRRLAAINGQLVEMLQLMSNALRSGFAFTQSVELAAKQLESPMRDELNHLLRDNALGARPDDALRALAERTASHDVEMMVTTILVQRTTGGNLSEILDNVAETVRERERLQGEIRSLTASQRLTGLILSLYPIALGLIFTLVAPDLMSVLWKTSTGLVLLGIAVSLQVLGMLTIRQVLKLDV